MPGSRLRSSSPASHPSPPLSETNSGSTADCSDGQSLGARLRRGAHIASNNTVLRRMYSLGGGLHTNHNRALGGGGGVNNHRQQQQQQLQQQQQQHLVAPESSSLTVTGNSHSTGFGASPGSESVGSTETGGPGTGGSKWGDMPFYSLFARSAGLDMRGQSSTGTAPTVVAPIGAAGAAPAVAVTAGSNVRNGAVDHKEEKVRAFGSKSSAPGTEPVAAGPKRTSPMRRSESLPAEVATAITGLKRRGPNNFWARNAAVPPAFVELSSGGRGTAASSVLPPEEPPPPPPPPLAGTSKAVRLVKQKQQQQQQQENGDAPDEEEVEETECAGVIALEKNQSSPFGGVLESSSSVNGKVTLAQEDLASGRSRSIGRDDRKRLSREPSCGGDDVEVLRRKVQALGRVNKRLSKKVWRRDKMVSDLKKKVQFYRERLASHEPPLPEDAVNDRRAKAREWQRSLTRSRSRGGMNDSEFEASDSGHSRSPLSSRLDEHSRFSRTETGSTLASTPGSLYSQPSRGNTPAPSLSASVSGSKSFVGEVAAAVAAAAAAERRLRAGPPATTGGGDGGGGGDLVPPPLGRIRLSSFGLSTSPTGSLPAVAADSSGDRSPAPLGSSRIGMRRKIVIPPATPGAEANDRVARDKEERSARAAQAAAARSAWVYEGEHQTPTGSRNLLFGGGGGGGGVKSRVSAVSTGQWPLTSNLRGACVGEAGISPVVIERADTMAPTALPPPQQQQQQQHTKGSGGDAAWSEGLRVPESSKANGARTSENAAVGDGYGGMEGGGSSDTGSCEQPPSVDHKKLFRPNLIVEFSEDSPAFRRKVDALDRNVEGLRGHLQQLVMVARKYCGSGFAFCEHGRELAGILMNMRGESWFTRLGALAPALVSLGEVLGDIQAYQEESLLQSLENTFCAPMEDFVKREVKTIRKMKQEMNRASEDHEHAMARFLQLKRNSEEGVTQARTAEVALAKKRFEMARFDLVQHLNQLETRKKHEVVDRTCSALYAYLKLFHQCYMLVASTEPHMRELQHALKLSREDLEKDDRMWTEKRSDLEASLNEGIPASALSRGSVPPTPSPAFSNSLPVNSSGITLTPTFCATWGGSNNAASVGGVVSNIVPPHHPPATSRSSQDTLARSAPSGAVATAFFLAGPSPSSLGTPGLSGGPALTGQLSVNTPLRSAQKRAVSLASRLASNVSGSGGGGCIAGAETPGSSLGGLSSHANTPSGVGVAGTCIDGVDAVEWGVSKRSSVAVSAGGDTESSYCPSPLPSMLTSAGGKLGGIWRTGGGGWTSDEDEEDDEAEEGEEGSGGGGAGGESGNGGKAGDADTGMSEGTLWSPRQERVIKGGYLWKRSTNVRKDWKRRYFFIQNGKLFYQRQEAYVSPPVRICDIKLCHVKSCLKESDLRFSFEIISPKQRTYLLQAEDEESHQSWVSVIKAEIEHLLAASQPLTGHCDAKMKALANGYRQEGSLYAAPQEFPLNKSQYNKLMQANPECVDCRARDPDWASISLGVMMCIECSGIHRSMGVHVSKVRSLTLDRWTAPLLDLLEKGGNDRANKVWEAYKNDPIFTKITPDCDRPSRETFIRAKYERRRFLDPPFDSSPEATLHASRRLSVAAREGDLLNALWCLAHGAIINWRSPEEHGCTAVQEAAKRSHVALRELLVNNGWSLDAPSSEKPRQEEASTVAATTTTATTIATAAAVSATAAAPRSNKNTRDSAMLSLLLSKLPTVEPRQPLHGGVTGGASNGVAGVGGGGGVGARADAPQSTAAAAANAAAKVALAFQQQQQHRR